ALETAIAETVFHFEAFARDSADPPRSEDMRVLVGTVAGVFEDVAAMPDEERRAIIDRDSYAASQAFAVHLRANGADGIAYPSVRQEGGQCVGVFRARLVGIPRQERHLKYRWNGERVDRYFDYSRDAWVGL
ncbi:MAG TPA: RES family NAD+ phosphorylase, partial [Acidisoma sp.]|nr:RES family NAD+ phosphorylase [Acidisoma sp.]